MSNSGTDKTGSPWSLVTGFKNVGRLTGNRGLGLGGCFKGTANSWQEERCMLATLLRDLGMPSFPVCLCKKKKTLKFGIQVSLHGPVKGLLSKLPPVILSGEVSGLVAPGLPHLNLFHTERSWSRLPEHAWPPFTLLGILGRHGLFCFTPWSGSTIIPQNHAFQS